MDTDHSSCAAHALVKHLDQPDYGMRPALHLRLNRGPGTLLDNLARVNRLDMVAALRLDDGPTVTDPGLYAWSGETDTFDLLAIGESPRNMLLTWMSCGFTVPQRLLDALVPHWLPEAVGVCLHGQIELVMREVRVRAQQRSINSSLHVGWMIFPEPDWEVWPPRPSRSTTRTGKQ